MSLQTTCQEAASGGSEFTDSAIMDMTTPTVSPHLKSRATSDRFDAEVVIPFDQPTDGIQERFGQLANIALSRGDDSPPYEAIEALQDCSDDIESTLDPFGKDELGEAVLSPPDTVAESEFEPDPELVSHLSTTVSSLRLRHQEQLHLHSLFTSKLEALAQRSLEHEAIIRSFTAELQSLRDSNALLGCKNDMLAQENNNLRAKMQDLEVEIAERTTVMEAMKGAVRGLEGWIGNASVSPESDLQRGLLQRQDRRRRREGGREFMKGKGKSPGRYRLDDGLSTLNGGFEPFTDREPLEIQEGVRAWVRGFKDVEEGLNARSEGNNTGRRAKQEDGGPPASQSNNTTHIFDEEFGDFETGG